MSENPLSAEEVHSMMERLRQDVKREETPSQVRVWYNEACIALRRAEALLLKLKLKDRNDDLQVP